MQAVTSFPIPTSEPVWKSFVLLGLIATAVWVARHEARHADSDVVIATLRAELDTLKGELAGLRAEMGALRETSEGIAATVSTASGQLSAADQRLARKIRTVEGKTDRNAAGLEALGADMEEVQVATGIPSARRALGPEGIAGNIVVDASALAECQRQFKMVDWGRLSAAAKADLQANPRNCAEVVRGIVEREELDSERALLACKLVEPSPRWDTYRHTALVVLRGGMSCPRALLELPR